MKVCVTRKKSLMYAWSRSLSVTTLGKRLTLSDESFPSSALAPAPTQKCTHAHTYRHTQRDTHGDARRRADTHTDTCAHCSRWSPGPETSGLERFGSGSWDKKRKMGGRRCRKRGALADDFGKSPDAELRGREGRNSKGILRSVAVP